MKRVNTELEVRHFSVYQKGYNSKRAGKWAVKQMDKSPKPCRRLKRRHGAGGGGVRTARRPLYQKPEILRSWPAW